MKKVNKEKESLKQAKFILHTKLQAIKKYKEMDNFKMIYKKRSFYN